MNGYIIYNTQSEAEISRMVGGTMTAADILAVNGFDSSTISCAKFDIADGFDILDYDLNSGTPALKTSSQDTAKRALLIEAEKQDAIEALIAPQKTVIKNMSTSALDAALTARGLSL